MSAAKNSKSKKNTKSTKRRAARAGVQSSPKKNAAAKVTVGSTSKPRSMGDLIVDSVNAEHVKELMRESIKVELENVVENAFYDDQSLFDGVSAKFRKKTAELIKSGLFDDEIELAAESALRRRLAELVR